MQPEYNYTVVATADIERQVGGSAKPRDGLHVGLRHALAVVVQ